MNCGIDVILYGDRGNSGRRNLKKYLGNKKKFRAGQMDQFELQVIELGRVLKVHVFSDLKSPNRRWLLDKMVVRLKDNDESEWEFKCRRYFDPSKGDGQTDRLLELGKDADYESDEAGSGDSSSLKNVFRNEFKPGKNRELPPPPLSPVRPVMQKGEDVPDDLWEIWWENRKIQQAYPKVGVVFVMVGEYGESHNIPMVIDLKAGTSTPRKIVLRQDLIGDLDKIRMRFSDQVASVGMKWEVAKIHLKHLVTGEITTFSFERPVLQKSHGDSTVEASSNGLIPNRSYTCEMYSGDRPGFLDEEIPHVYVMIRGKRGDTGKRWIDPERGSIIWRKNSMASFEIQCVDLGDITGIKFGHDKRGKDASYYLEKIVIKPNHLSDVRYVFQFDKVSVAAKFQEDVSPKMIKKRPLKSVRMASKAIVKPLTFNKKKAERNLISESQYDTESEEEESPDEWHLSWICDESQKPDFIQIALTLIGNIDKACYLIDIEIKPGESDVYNIRLARDIGELMSVNLKHGPKVVGEHPQWQIIEMQLENRATGQLFKFKPDNPTPAKVPEKPIKTIVPKVPSAVVEEKPSTPPPVKKPGPFFYNVVVYTGISSRPVHQQQPDVYIRLFGDYTTDPCWFEAPVTRGVAFRPGQRDVFKIKLDEDIGPVENVRIGYGKSDDDSDEPVVIDKVIIQPLHEPGIEYSFSINPDEAFDRGPLQWLLSWVCSHQQVETRCRISAFIYGGGRKHDSEVVRDVTLRPGRSEEILCEWHAMSKPDETYLPYKVRLGFSQTNLDCQWNINYVVLRCIETGKMFTFTAHAPVIVNDSIDGWTEYALDTAPNARGAFRIIYEVRIENGVEMANKLDSLVKINIKGRYGDTGDRALKTSRHHGSNNFKPGQANVFWIEAVDLGTIRAISIGHDNSGIRKSWQCSRIEILNRRSGELYEFSIDSWFDIKKDDGLIERRFRPNGVAKPPPQSRQWLISLAVNPQPHSGTLEPICLVICGRKASSSIISLSVAEGFHPGEVYDFPIFVELNDIDMKIGEVVKVRIGFVEWTTNPAILLSRITLKEITTGAKYWAVIDEWIWADVRHDSWREFPIEGGSMPVPAQVIRYQLSLWTGNHPEADTDGDVYVQLDGVFGDSGKRRLARSISHCKAFNSGQMDLFDIECIDLGELTHISVTLAPETAGGRDNWNLIRILILTHPFASDELLLDCDDWFDNSVHTKRFTIPPYQPRSRPAGLDPSVNFLFYVSTGPEQDMARSANAVVEIFGDRGAFGPYLLNKPNRTPGLDDGNISFVPGGVDCVPLIINEGIIGKLLKLRLQNLGAKPSWFVDKLVLYHLGNPRTEPQHFDVFDWLSSDFGDGDSIKEYSFRYIRQPTLQVFYYSVEIENGPNSTPKTYLFDHVTCYIEMFGATPLSSGIRPLRKNVDKNLLFQPGRKNLFTFNAVGVGDLTRIRVGHTDSSGEFQWHIIGIEISWGDKTRMFQCDRILAKPPNGGTEPIEITLE